jgi:hypothetical protein
MKTFKAPTIKIIRFSSDNIITASGETVTKETSYDLAHTWLVNSSVDKDYIFTFK